MTRYDEVKQDLSANPRIWAVTGVAGFIGSNLLETLLTLDQHVIGLDNFESGYRRNLDIVRTLVSREQWDRFRFIEGDICSLDDCRAVCEGAHYVLHQAALGSVPRSLIDPIATNAANVTGFLNMLVAARDAKVKRFVYAASSSTYGDNPTLPKIEDDIGNPLSPYAVTKYVNELYASVFARCYDFQSIGLRYFNVFGQRQDPNGAYAAVIPKWTAEMIEGRDVVINGDGETSRDFCFIENAVQANLLAATVVSPEATDQVYNVAVGECTSLNQLHAELRNLLARYHSQAKIPQPVYGPFRAGDVRHSQADICKAQRLLGYSPSHQFTSGLAIATNWLLQQQKVSPTGNR